MKRFFECGQRWLSSDFAIDDTCLSCSFMLETLPLAASTYNRCATPPREEPIPVDDRTDTSSLPNRNETADPPRRRGPSVVAVDAGGTSTRAVWLASDGTCLGYGRAAGGNPVSRGVGVAAGQLADAVSQAAGPTRRFPRGSAPEVAVLAMAGAGGADAETLQLALAEVGFSGRLSFGSDLLAGYLSGATEVDGYGIVAGTGAAAIRVQGGVDVAIADGVGWLLGDRGSGFWIGRRAVRSTMRALDGAAALPPLARAVLAECGIAAPAGRLVGGRHAAVVPLVQALYAAAPVDLARLAPLTIRLAMEGDPEARAIAESAVQALLDSLEAVLDPDRSGPIVISGGIALALPGLVAALEGLQRAHGWPADVRTAGDGLFGAAQLALTEAGFPLTDEVLDRLRVELTAAPGLFP
jgi:glucosamine kinase